MNVGADLKTRDAATLANALERFEAVARCIGNRPILVCLDYDGTLTPIVASPEEAKLNSAPRSSVRSLSSVCPLAIVSGRDLRDVQALVGLEGIYYAGSHGFEIETPLGEGINLEEAWPYLPVLGGAEETLRSLLGDVPGAQVERKRFAIAVHYRKVHDDHLEAVRRSLDSVSRDHPGLRRNSGKRVYELRPNLDWDKGKALRRIQELVDQGRPSHCPIYIGDDTTDEDAFAEIEADGLGILVREETSKGTRAGYALDGTVEVRSFLDRLAAFVDRKDRQGPATTRDTST